MFPGLLRFRQFRFQVVAKVLFVLPRRIAEGARGAVDEIKALFDEGAALQGREKGGVRLQFRQIRKDRGCLFVREIRESLRRVGEGREIPKGRLLVELGSLIGR